MSMRRRETKLIDREIQLALARRLTLHWIVFIIVAVVLACLIQWLGKPFTSIGDLLNDVWATLSPLLLVMLCLIPIFIYDSVKLSSRFAGPVLRVRRAARSLAAGEKPEKLSFRNGDFWHGLAEDFNQVIDQHQPISRSTDQ